MNGKSLVEMRIPTEEVGNIEELGSEGYERGRSDASRDMIRLDAAHLRSSYRFVETLGGEKR